MSSAATLIASLGTLNWNARVYDVLALASKLAVAVKNRGNVLRLAYHLRRLNDKLSELVTLVNEAMEGRRTSDADAERVTPQTLRSSADSFEQMYHTIEYILEGARRAGLFNNSLTAAPLRGIARNTEAIANLADWLDLAAQPAAIEEIFQRANQEKSRGELIDLAQIE